jgi:hypothetical protein
MPAFRSVISIIGVNPYVPVPDKVLQKLFISAKKSRGPIPVKGMLNGKPFIQHIVKFKGIWRLYLNTAMRQAAGIDTGDLAKVTLAFDGAPRITPMHPALDKAFAKNKKAKAAFEKLAPYRKKEIMRYINSLKTEVSVAGNIGKIINHLLKGDAFAGRRLK